MLLICSVSSLTFQTRRCGARSKSNVWLIGLAAEEIHDPEQKREDSTEEQASNDWKIEAAVSSLVGDVARQAAEAKGQSRSEEQECSYYNQNDADDKEGSSQFAERTRGHPNLESSHGVLGFGDRVFRCAMATGREKLARIGRRAVALSVMRHSIIRSS